MDHDPERRGLSQGGKLLFVLFVILCAIYTWILLVAHGWRLAVPGLVSLGLIVAGIWLKRARKGPFKSLPGEPHR